MSPALLGALLRLTGSRSATPKSAQVRPSPPPSAPADLNAITAVGGLLQPHHHAVGRAAAIHHSEPHEAGPFRLEEQRAPSSRRRPRHAAAPDRQHAPGPPAPQPSIGMDVRRL